MTIVGPTVGSPSRYRFERAACLAPTVDLIHFFPVLPQATRRPKARVEKDDRARERRQRSTHTRSPPATTPSRLRKKAGLREAQLSSGVAESGQRSGLPPFDPAEPVPKARSWALTSRRRRLRQQGSQAQQVVGRAGEEVDRRDPGLAAVAQLAQAADGLHPDER